MFGVLLFFPSIQLAVCRGLLGGGVVLHHTADRRCDERAGLTADGM